VRDSDPEEYARLQQEIEDKRETFNANTREHSKSYRGYLVSDHWQKTRQQKLRSTNGLCELCGSIASEIHHKNYDCKGSELLEELETLCRSCHEKRHRAVREHRR
jgi:5-methylcytosine-specific restriction endonuclease McrA